MKARAGIGTSIVFVSLIALAFGLFFWVGHYAESTFTAANFRPRFPEKELSYSADELKALVGSSIRNDYISPILFPLDLLVMLSLSGTKGAASWYWIRQVRPTAARLALILPAVYLLSDLIEDSLLASLLRQGDPEKAAAAMAVLKIVTAIKFASITGTIAQTVFAAWLFLTRAAKQ